MTTTELHKILDNKDMKLSVKQIEQVIYEMKCDCIHEMNKVDVSNRLYAY